LRFASVCTEIVIMNCSRGSFRPDDASDCVTRFLRTMSTFSRISKPTATIFVSVFISVRGRRVLNSVRKADVTLTFSTDVSAVRFSVPRSNPTFQLSTASGEANDSQICSAIGSITARRLAENDLTLVFGIQAPFSSCSPSEKCNSPQSVSPRRFLLLVAFYYLTAVGRRSRRGPVEIQLTALRKRVFPVSRVQSESSDVWKRWKRMNSRPRWLARDTMKLNSYSVRKPITGTRIFAIMRHRAGKVKKKIE